MFQNAFLRFVVEFCLIALVCVLFAGPKGIFFAVAFMLIYFLMKFSVAVFTGHFRR
jgi:hypothetical protein